MFVLLRKPKCRELQKFGDLNSGNPAELAPRRAGMHPLSPNIEVNVGQLRSGSAA